jgi:hypothetical protein
MEGFQANFEDSGQVGFFKDHTVSVTDSVTTHKHSFWFLTQELPGHVCRRCLAHLKHRRVA